MESFDEAVGILRRLLAQHGRPAVLVWICRQDIRTIAGRAFVRVPVGLATPEQARETYEAAAAKYRAICLDVVGHSLAHSFACVDVAADSADAEQRMMSPDHVKVSIPYEAGRPPTEIHSGAAWAAISLLAG